MGFGKWAGVTGVWSVIEGREREGKEWERGGKGEWMVEEGNWRREEGRRGVERANRKQEGVELERVEGRKGRRKE